MAVATNIMNWDSFKDDLLGPDPQKSLKAATDLSERIEIVHSTEYPALLQEGLPAFTTVLQRKCTPDDPLRKCLLEILSRLPSNEILRKHAPQLLQIAMNVLQHDYEENALLASRIIFDLHKHFRSMQEQVQPYLDFVQASYKALPQSIERNFSSTSPATSPAKPIASPLSSAASSTPSSTPLPSLSSFRVLTECPLTVMLLFQLYPNFLKANIPSLISLMMDCLGLRAPPPSAQQNRRDHYSRNRELVAAQVKTLSFLTYLLRGFAQDMRVFEERLASNVVALMQTCPREALSTRKELLVATRHILATEFRKGFFVYMDQLLDDRVLMGHRFSCESLQPLGYSTLADLVHHVRALLSVKQLSRVIYMFSRVLHDSSLKLPMAIQITAVRLLLNLVDIIFHSKSSQPTTDPQVGKDLLGRILDTLVNKLGTLQKHPIMIEERNNLEKKRLRRPSDSPTVTLEEDGRQEFKDATDVVQESAFDHNESKNTPKSPADVWLSMGDESTDSLRDLQSIVRSIVVGLKTVIWCVNNYRLNKDDEIIKITSWEHDLIDKYIIYSLPCMRIFSDNDAQYRDVLTYFGASFTVLDSHNFRQIVGHRIDVLIDATVEDQHIMVVTRHLLGSKMSCDFTHVLLSHLVEHLGDLSTIQHQDMVFVKTPHHYWDLTEVEKSQQRARETMLDMRSETEESNTKRKARASTILELFERVLKSLGSHPDNETALRPYLRKIVSSSLRTSMEAFCRDWPDNYCILLRCVFRSISGGKFEESYKELLPLIPTTLNGLYKIYQSTDDTSLRHTIIELCLTIPARLSSLLPHMSLLLQMIIPSLQSENGDLVNLGLRTLEFWIDNLNPEFLYPILSKQSVVFVELMTSLSKHLQPAPYPYGLLTLRLLGKLGGKNRRFLREPFEQHSAYSRLRRQLDVLAIDFVWDETEPLATTRPIGYSKAVGDEAILKDEITSPSFKVLLPLERAVEVLALIAASPEFTRSNEDIGDEQDGEFRSEVTELKWADHVQLLELEPDAIDIQAYCQDVVGQTKVYQARAAFTIISSSLALVIDVGDKDYLGLRLGSALTPVENGSTTKVEWTVENEDTPAISRGSLSIPSTRLQKEDMSLRLIIRGLMIGSSVEPIQEECRMLLKGLSSHFLFLAATYGSHIKRIDVNGCRILNQHTGTTAENGDVNENNPAESSEGQPRTSPRAAFGCFELSGPLDGKVDLFSFNEAIGDFLCSPAPSSDDLLPYLITHLLETSDALRNDDPNHVLSFGTDVLLENLLSVLCRLCSSLTWNLASRAYNALCTLIGGLGMDWSKRYEVEILHSAILAVKKCPKEIPYAGVKSFQFFSEVCSKLYGQPSIWTDIDEESTLMIRDALCVPNEKRQKNSISEECKEGKKVDIATTVETCCIAFCPSDEVIHILINELASTSHIVR
jgi:hypothetical protein